MADASSTHSLAKNCRRPVRKASLNSYVIKRNSQKERKEKLKQVSEILKKPEHERTDADSDLVKKHPDIVKASEQNAKRLKANKERALETEDSPETIDKKCEELAELIESSDDIVVYTGAGISTSASIPDYRGPNGVWTLLKKGQGISPQDLSDAEPTFTHMSITKLYRVGKVKHVVSQNCDGLHIRSGYPRYTLSEVHGNMFIECCYACAPHREYVRLFDVTERTGVRRHTTARSCKTCAGKLVDTIVHFGEKGKLKSPYRWKEAVRAVKKADLILCLGSSLKVLKRYSCLWSLDKKPQNRPRLAIINLQWTPKDDVATLKINGRCDDVMRKVMQILDYEVPEYSRDFDPLFRLYTPLRAVEYKTTTKKILIPPPHLDKSRSSKAKLKQLQSQKVEPPPCKTEDDVKEEVSQTQSCKSETNLPEHEEETDQKDSTGESGNGPEIKTEDDSPVEEEKPQSDTSPIEEFLTEPLKDENETAAQEMSESVENTQYHQTDDESVEQQENNSLESTSEAAQYSPEAATEEPELFPNTVIINLDEGIEIEKAELGTDQDVSLSQLEGDFAGLVKLCNETGSGTIKDDNEPLEVSYYNVSSNGQLLQDITLSNSDLSDTAVQCYAMPDSDLASFNEDTKSDDTVVINFDNFENDLPVSYMSFSNSPGSNILSNTHATFVDYNSQDSYAKSIMTGNDVEFTSYPAAPKSVDLDHSYIVETGETKDDTSENYSEKEWLFKNGLVQTSKTSQGNLYKNPLCGQNETSNESDGIKLARRNSFTTINSLQNFQSSPADFQVESSEMDKQRAVPACVLNMDEIDCSFRDTNTPFRIQETRIQPSHLLVDLILKKKSSTIICSKSVDTTAEEKDASTLYGPLSPLAENRTRFSTKHSSKSDSLLSFVIEEDLLKESPVKQENASLGPTSTIPAAKTMQTDSALIVSSKNTVKNDCSMTDTSSVNSSASSQQKKSRFFEKSQQKCCIPSSSVKKKAVVVTTESVQSDSENRKRLVQPSVPGWFGKGLAIKKKKRV